MFEEQSPFSVGLQHFTFPPSLHEGSDVFTSSLTHVVFCLLFFYGSHPIGWSLEAILTQKTLNLFPCIPQTSWAGCTDPTSGPVNSQFLCLRFRCPLCCSSPGCPASLPSANEVSRVSAAYLVFALLPLHSGDCDSGDGRFSICTQRNGIGTTSILQRHHLISYF